MVGWHHRLSGHEFEQTPEDGEGQGSLVCRSSDAGRDWGQEEKGTTQSLLKLMSTESMMPSNSLILHHPLLLLPSIFPSIRVFSNELALHIRWPKY